MNHKITPSTDLADRALEISLDLKLSPPLCLYFALAEKVASGQASICFEVAAIVLRIRFQRKLSFAFFCPSLVAHSTEGT